MLNTLKVAALTWALAGLVAPPAHAGHRHERYSIRRVLLLSIDGMHALDYANCVRGGTAHMPQLKREIMGVVSVSVLA